MNFASGRGDQVKINKRDVEELKKKVALGNRVLFHQGLADYHGHLSARIPGTRKFLIKPVLAPLGTITGRNIIIVDIDESLTLDPKAVEKAITPRTKAILVVHMVGHLVHGLGVYQNRSQK